MKELYYSTEVNGVEVNIYITFTKLGARNCTLIAEMGKGLKKETFSKVVKADPYCDEFEDAVREFLRIAETKV